VGGIVRIYGNYILSGGIKKAYIKKIHGPLTVQPFLFVKIVIEI
jgi:hypothetical protein